MNDKKLEKTRKDKAEVAKSFEAYKNYKNPTQWGKEPKTKLKLK